MDINEKIDKYLIDEGKIDFEQYYNQPNWHEEAGDVASAVEDMLDRGKKKDAKKYLKDVIKRGVPHWHEEAVDAAEELLSQIK